jgi:hypothetical protein
MPTPTTIKPTVQGEAYALHQKRRKGRDEQQRDHGHHGGDEGFLVHHSRSKDWRTLKASFNKRAGKGEGGAT